jgi:tetraacyldisaccharide 4'-kinase
MKNCMRFDITRHWYQKRLTVLTALLLPFSWLFRLVVFIRRSLYQKNIFKQYQLPVPVIIVGNITVGGTGKTPFVIWLARYLQTLGLKPGILTRGYGGNAKEVLDVTLNSTAEQVGDEALVLKQRTQCPVFVSKSRVAAGKALLAKYDCDIIICDDGLQHYALARDIECVLIDRFRGFGNQQMLPAGPLREPLTRLSSVDVVVDDVSLQMSSLVSLNNNETVPLTQFTGQRVHAVAGIGYPEQFFQQLRDQGVNVIAHAFTDHHAFQKNDLTFHDELPIIMTEKDAVKCRHFALPNTWYLPIEITPSPQCIEKLHFKIEHLRGEKHAETESDFQNNTCRKYLGR